jgi:hypothetical protein
MGVSCEKRLLVRHLVVQGRYAPDIAIGEGSYLKSYGKEGKQMGGPGTWTDHDLQVGHWIDAWGERVKVSSASKCPHCGCPNMGVKHGFISRAWAKGQKRFADT